MTRFHLDEHVDPVIAAGQRRRGIDVTATVDAGLIGAEDRDHLAFALAEGRVVVTNDADYLKLHEQGVPHAAIVCCRRGSRTVGEIIRFLSLLHACLTAEEMRGQVEYA